MRHQFFTIPTLDPTPGQDEFNRFCAAHRVVSLDKQFVADGGASFWSICVGYQDAGGEVPGQRRPRVDYKEVLNERDFVLFDRLRKLRKELAESEGVPAYALFTNEQLAEMVRRRVDSPTALDGIEGVGSARIEKYGARFVEALRAALGEDIKNRIDAPGAD